MPKNRKLPGCRGGSIGKPYGNGLCRHAPERDELGRFISNSASGIVIRDAPPQHNPPARLTPRAGFAPTVYSSVAVT